MSKELEPCPLTGAIPVMGPQDPAMEGDAWTFIKSAVTRSYDEGLSDVTITVTVIASDQSLPPNHKAAAIAAWNTRAPDPKVKALVEAARALANAIDVGGVDCWDTDDLDTNVVAVQHATTATRAALAAIEE